jgi:hypothetical protein
MATFTIRHGARMTLEKTGHGIRRAWGRFTSGRAWVNFKAKHSPEWIVCEEITHGANGWHPHLHVLFFLPKRASLDELIELQSEMYERWASLVVQEMDEACAPLPGPGVDFRPCNDPEYLQKLGLELSNLGTKTGNGRTPLEVLAAWLESPPDPTTGELDMSRREFGLYQEFERTMKGKRDLTWSRGLKSFREQAKQQIKDEQSRETELVADVPPAVWAQVCEQRGARVELLEHAERLGFAGVVDWVTRNFGEDSAAEVRQWTALERQRKPQRSESAASALSSCDVARIGDAP